MVISYVTRLNICMTRLMRGIHLYGNTTETAMTSRIFGVVSERRKLKVNVGKNKGMVCSKERQRADLRVRLKGELLEEMESFRYL